MRKSYRELYKPAEKSSLEELKNLLTSIKANNARKLLETVINKFSEAGLVLGEYRKEDRKVYFYSPMEWVFGKGGRATETKEAPEISIVSALSCLNAWLKKNSPYLIWNECRKGHPFFKSGIRAFKEKSLFKIGLVDARLPRA